MRLNERAQRIADQLADNAPALDIAIHHTPAGARILDCGIKVEGGLEAGLGMARTCLAGLAEVSLAPGDIGGLPCAVVSVATDQPVLACLASQYAGCKISVGKFFAMGSGPFRAAYGKEELFNDIPGREHAPVAVGVLETHKMPDDDVINYLCERLGMTPAQITLLVAPAASLAGNLQVVAR